LIYRLVLENLKHRPVRTILTAIAIGIQVTLILTLVGVSRGMLHDVAERNQGVGGDLMIAPPDSSLLGNNGTMPEGVVRVVRGVPHVAYATGTLVQLIGPLEYITGIHLDEFNAISGGFQYLEGGPFQRPDDVLIDEVESRSKHLHAGDTLELGRKWHVAGVVASGKLSRIFADMPVIQHLYPPSGNISRIYVKVDKSENIDAVKDALENKLDKYKINKMEDLVSLFTADATPYLRPFTSVVIGISVIVGFLVVFLSMYTAVLERTREIGILKALGASPGYVLGILMRETVLLAIAGTIAGILMTFGARWLLKTFAPTVVCAIVEDWWPIAGVLALVGALIGAAYPGLKAARQDAIEALAYD
jgi:putative ABC transport system permease protein